MAQTLKVSRYRFSIERVYREHREQLWRALAAFTGDGDTASDALAETFAQALARGDKIERPVAWVWRTAFRMAAGELQRRTRQREPMVESSYSLPEPIDHVVSALGRISPKQRLAVILHDYADRPINEIAETLGISRATVYVHLSQGRRRLKQMLEVDDG